MNEFNKTFQRIDAAIDAMTFIVNVIVSNCLIISFIRLFCFVFHFLFIDIISIWFNFNRYEFFDFNINDSFSSYCFMNSLNLSSRLFVFRIFLNFFIIVTGTRFYFSLAEILLLRIRPHRLELIWNNSKSHAYHVIPSITSFNYADSIDIFYISFW